MSKASEMFKELSEKERKKYEDMHAAAKKVYEAQQEELKKNQLEVQQLKAKLKLLQV